MCVAPPSYSRSRLDVAVVIGALVLLANGGSLVVLALAAILVIAPWAAIIDAAEKPRRRD